MKNKLVLVYWVDIVADAEWCTKNDFDKKCFPDPCLSVGFIVRETKDTLWIAADITEPDKNSCSESDCGGIRAIPKGVISQIKTVSVRGARSRRK